MRRAPRIELAVEVLLLVTGVVYLVVMLGYARNAGIVPAIAAVVMILAVLTQMAQRRRARHAGEDAARADDAEALAGAGADVLAPADADVLAGAAPVPHEPEAFDGLIGDAGMDRAARRRLLAIGAWAVAVVTAMQALGFVTGGVVAVVAFQLLARQPARIVLVTAFVVGFGVYAITDLIIGIPWNDAPLLQLLAG